MRKSHQLGIYSSLLSFLVAMLSSQAVIAAGIPDYSYCLKSTLPKTTTSPHQKKRIYVEHCPYFDGCSNVDDLTLTVWRVPCSSTDSAVLISIYGDTFYELRTFDFRVVQNGKRYFVKLVEEPGGEILDTLPYAYYYPEYCSFCGGSGGSRQGPLFLIEQFEGQPPFNDDAQFTLEYYDNPIIPPNFPVTIPAYNPALYPNTDGDGVFDYFDTDDDNDGLSDADEVAKGTDRIKADTDGDGVNDGRDEFPLDPSRYGLKIVGDVHTTKGLGICAIVLASGKYMFSCNPIGDFSLINLLREKDGTIKRQIYADGFFPKTDILSGSSNDTVVMTRSGICPSYNNYYEPGYVPDSAGKHIYIAGKVLVQGTQTPICAMVLANGQYTFSCDGMGSYALKIPLDSNGLFKLQVYADGFAPNIQTFDEFKTTNIVRMARAAECQ